MFCWPLYKTRQLLVSLACSEWLCAQCPSPRTEYHDESQNVSIKRQHQKCDTDATGPLRITTLKKSSKDYKTAPVKVNLWCQSELLYVLSVLWILALLYCNAELKLSFLKFRLAILLRYWKFSITQFSKTHCYWYKHRYLPLIRDNCCFTFFQEQSSCWYFLSL